MLLVKYVTDKAKSDPNSLIEVPNGGSFDDMLALRGDKEIGDRINKIISELAEANDLQKVIDLADSVIVAARGTTNRLTDQA